MNGDSGKSDHRNFVPISPTASSRHGLRFDTNISMIGLVVVSSVRVFIVLWRRCSKLLITGPLSELLSLSLNQRYTYTPEMVLVVDDEDHENEGNLVMAASKVIPEAMTLFVKHCTGIVCVSMKEEDLERLHIPLMVDSKENEEELSIVFTLSVTLG